MPQQRVGDDVQALVTDVVAAQVQLLDRLRLVQAVFQRLDTCEAHLILFQIEDLQVFFVSECLADCDRAFSKDAVVVEPELSDVFLVK